MGVEIMKWKTEHIKQRKTTSVLLSSDFGGKNHKGLKYTLIFFVYAKFGCCAVHTQKKILTKLIKKHLKNEKKNQRYSLWGIRVLINVFIVLFSASKLINLLNAIHTHITTCILWFGGSFFLADVPQRQFYIYK